jgi:hypothetical protein
MVMMEAAKAFNEKIGEFVLKMPSERTF